MKENKIGAIARYLCQNYPFPDELSKARFTKMFYLADWKNSVDHGHQLTDIEWRFNHYGPYVEDIVNQLKTLPDFEIISTQNIFGGFKEIVRLKDMNSKENLSRDEKEVLDFVIQKTSRLNWRQFINMVYSTFPVANSTRGDILNLPNLATVYKSYRSN
ncbi:conserved hypothetical protein [Desulfatibacillum aliphaticivorans]|uniref:Antitoxin SocA-like Panacea domain-containing protein n=1 Tax=Desulfatibacillum aliphaticivorans TaxID=218208 RepID=B8FBW7_DESAL|nr:Panacea domain-containing protein [Desulfatibacillum aliphaticivorans]ACL05172.1 conserved hypothetical protein [Desulfatibacillum aliphaticivorans]